MRYRGELEALNALVAAQERTNELLEKLLTSNTPAQPIEDKPKRTYTRRNKDAS